MPRNRALFISSNGIGMGHLTRLIAYAKHCEPDFAPYFFSLSQAVPIVESFGYQYEYLASRDSSGLAARHWHEYLCKTLVATLDRIRPAIVVFDGTWPYEGIRLAQTERPEIRWIWSRRGMWRPGVNAAQVDKAAWFDAVIEPGDFAASADVGATAAAAAHRIDPVTLLDASELDDRATARKHLGLEPDTPHALVTLGAGAVNDNASDIANAVSALRTLGITASVTSSDITNATPMYAGIHVIREYPLSRYYRAFDLAVSASGYNSFHELLRFGVPTLFVANPATTLDDQLARAKWARASGVAHSVDKLTIEDAVPLLLALLENGTAMTARIAEIDPGNGAPAAASHIRQVALGTN